MVDLLRNQLCEVIYERSAEMCAPMKSFNFENVNRFASQFNFVSLQPFNLIYIQLKLCFMSQFLFEALLNEKAISLKLFSIFLW